MKPAPCLKIPQFFDIEVDDVVEVSGFRVSPTQINATYVEETVEDVDFQFYRGRITRHHR